MGGIFWKIDEKQGEKKVSMKKIEREKKKEKFYPPVLATRADFNDYHHRCIMYGPHAAT